ncbi:MAG: bifunctional riboflavin kinase/FAD synthetase [Bacillota bacterium]|nr:bifunctional riboflavin kinase/FAD synthetase [Bacillota bacterium]
MTVTDKAISCETVVAIGGFNAVHKGHLMLIDEAVDTAKKMHMKSCIYTFDDRLEQHKGGKKFMPGSEKLKLFEKLGIDVVFVQQFTDEFKSILPEEFVSEVLVKTLRCKCVIAGENFRFGRNLTGDAEVLKNLCEKYKIKCIIKKLEKTIGGRVISSSLMREFAAEGKVEKITEYCGRPMCIAGNVVHGRGEGRKMGFATANILQSENDIVPARGVYVSKVMADGKEYTGITNVGNAPTYDSALQLIETHLLGFEGDLYDKEIQVYFLEKIRDIEKFNSVKELTIQLEKDNQKAKSISDKYKL